MKALIIYQDVTSAARANAALQNLKVSAETRVGWEVVPWRLDMLKFPPSATEALAAASDAHLILFVGGLPQSLPFWLLDWLRKWAAARQIKEAALAITADANGDMPSKATISTLEQFAKEQELNFIWDTNLARESLIDPRLVDPRSIQPYVRWGINE